MMKKIAILLFVLLIVQMVLYARLYANELKQQAALVATAIEKFKIEDGSDQDIDAYLRSLGIQTRINESLLNQKYQCTTLAVDPLNGNTTIRFYNPKANNYRLDVYDIGSGLVASFVNVNSDNVVINKTLFDSGSYIYKLSGESNIYCGTFMIR